ncbi:hypothetical protein [Clostridium paraputrificum]|uniref:hypothetical protein n=1 Tax=Clostridium paraputrificum TaxID=29363 RepID=UPI00189F585E|nr:hypothetical protein [Clostridium paraputrificum]
MGRKKVATRVCNVCKNTFELLNTDYIKVKNKYIEVDCYIQKELNKGLTIDVINEKLNIIRETMKIELENKKNKELIKEQNKLNAKQREINRTENRNKFFNYIMEVYAVSVIPKYVYKKIAEINNGNYKGLSEGITYEDLLDMFIKKKGFLDKIHMKNTVKGNNMNSLSRFNYDLAVIINKYDSYKDWKRQQQLLQADIIQSQNKENAYIDYKKIKADVKQDKDNEIDVSDIISDIY